MTFYERFGDVGLRFNYMARPVIGRERGHLVVKGWQGDKMTHAFLSSPHDTFEWYALIVIFELRRDVGQSLIYWRQLIVVMECLKGHNQIIKRKHLLAQ